MAAKQSLYPDILFHFTTKDGLWGILRETFSISFSSEKIVGGNKSKEFSCPMVSFCDLKLSELKSHMEKYGNYGIGLTKEWANKNGLNPVFYVSKHSQFTSDFISALNDLESMPTDIDKKNTYMKLINSYRYIKNYEGNLTRKNGKTTRDYRFADEREWRYVPPIELDILQFAPTWLVSTSQDKIILNAMISHLNLRFEPEDIKYLIIDSDEEITELIQHLSEVKGRFNESTRQRLTSRILTSKQINNDI